MEHNSVLESSGSYFEHNTEINYIYNYNCYR